jgi:hypothetical protein
MTASQKQIAQQKNYQILDKRYAFTSYLKKTTTDEALRIQLTKICGGQIDSIRIIDPKAASFNTNFATIVFQSQT